MADTSTARLDDPAIPDSEVLYRRLSDGGPNMVVVDLETGTRRPSSGAFKPDQDGISVYRHQLLAGAGLGPNALVRDPLNLVVAVDVGEVRSIDLGVRDDPWPTGIPEQEHPRNAAHALITGFEGLGQGARKRRQQALVTLPSIRFVIG